MEDILKINNTDAHINKIITYPEKETQLILDSSAHASDLLIDAKMTDCIMREDI